MIFSIFSKNIFNISILKKKINFFLKKSIFYIKTLIPIRLDDPCPPLATLSFPVWGRHLLVTSYDTVWMYPIPSLIVN